MRDLYRWLVGERDAGHLRAVHGPRLVVNLVLSAATLVVGALWLARRTRLNLPQPEAIFMGFDFAGDIARESLLWSEVADAPLPNIIFYRSRAQKRSAKDKLAGWRTERIDSGLFGPGQAARELSSLARAVALITRCGGRLPVEVFRNLVKLPLRRAQFRGLLNRFHFRNFWGRDEYNPEHIIRSQELRRIGGRHFGRLHGLPAYPTRMAQQAYIDFDTYYTFGSDFARHCRSTWLPAMTVKPIGAFGLSRERLAALAAERPRDIVVFLSDSFQNDQSVQTAVELAEAFPERAVYMKPRPGGHGTWLEDYDSARADWPPNLQLYANSSDDAYFHAQYVFADPSTLVIEGLQYGLFSFALVLDPRWKDLYFEEFPDICVRSPAQAITRIIDIESGHWHYPRERFKDLVNLTGLNIWDAIRADLGLPPKGPVIFPHLAFVNANETQNLS